MITLTQLPFWLNFIYFFFAVFISFYIPGNLLLSKLKIDWLSKTVLSVILGYVLWGLFGYLFGFLKISFIFYPYIVGTIIIWLYLNRRVPKFNFSTFKKKLKRADLLIFLVLFVGFFTQLVTIFSNGLLRSSGIYFCCGAQDLIYHAALANSIVAHFPPFEPGAAGVVVKNYHYFSNLTVAYLVKIYHLPLFETYFQYFGVLFSLGIGLSAYVFAKSLKISKAYIFLLMFFLYFSGDLIYLFLFFIGKGFNLHYVFLEDPTKLWTSPSRVIAIPMFFGGLTFLSYWAKNRNVRFAILGSIIFASLIAIKVYVGILVLMGVFFLIIYLLVKKEFKSIFPWLLTFVISGALYMYVNSGAGGLIFVGTWRFENFIVQPIFGLSRMELARGVYLNAHSVLRVLEYESIYALVYFVVLFGTLNLAFVQTKKSLSLFPRELNIFLIPSLSVILFTGLFFIQKTGGANSSQFIITWEIFASIYASLSVYYFLVRKKTNLKLVLLLIIILLSSLRVISETESVIFSIKSSVGFHIPYSEVEALNYLRTQTPTSAIIMVDDNPLKKQYIMKKGKRMEVPIFESRNFEGLSSYYVPLISQREMFLDGGTAADVFGVDVASRMHDQDIVFEGKDLNDINKTLDKDKISYLYTIPQRASVLFLDKKLKKVFNNKSIVILKVE